MLYLSLHACYKDQLRFYLLWLATDIELALRANGPAGLIHGWHQPAIAEPVASGRPARRH